LLDCVRFGLTHLPEWIQLPILSDVSGGDTAESLKLSAGTDDVRTIVSYAAGAHVAIDQSCTHSHVDELAHMPFGEQTWGSIQSTISPGGSCHIVTRGAGDGNFTAQLWEAAQEPDSTLTPFFAPWNARPDRDPAWRAQQEATLLNQALLFFAPETADDALAGDETAGYIPMEVWDQCCDPDLKDLAPGDPTPVVIGVDGAVTGDMFAVVAVSRHPKRPRDPAIRGCRVWRPADFASGRNASFGSCVGGVVLPAIRARCLTLTAPSARPPTSRSHR
jgi:hypothetical protein